jgi:hypothetical protein
MIDDYDPEDALDADDPPATQLAVLERVVAVLRSNVEDRRHAGRRDDALRVVARLGTLRGADGRRLRNIKHALEDM